MTFRPIGSVLTVVKQAENPAGYSTRYGGHVTVQGDSWTCTGCGKSETADDVHHAAQDHAANCLSVGFN